MLAAGDEPRIAMAPDDLDVQSATSVKLIVDEMIEGARRAQPATASCAAPLDDGGKTPCAMPRRRRIEAVWMRSSHSRRPPCSRPARRYGPQRYSR